MDSFGEIVIAIVAVAIVVAAISFVGAGRLYERIGKGAFSLDGPEAPRLPPAGAGDLREEVRQLVIARNERRVRRGEEPLDVEAEVERELREAGGAEA